MKKLTKLSIFGLFCFPSLAFAHGIEGFLIFGFFSFLIAPFLFFFIIGHFRDRKNRLRYVSLCVLPALFSVLVISLFGIFTIWIIPVFFIGGIFLAEYTAKKGKQVKLLEPKQ